MIRINPSATAVMVIGTGLIVLSLVADLLFGGRLNFFGYWQIGGLLLGSLLFAGISYRQPDPGFTRMRRFAAACWVTMGGLGYLFYPHQWNLYYLVSFVTIGADKRVFIDVKRRG